MGNFVGKSIPRVDALEKVTGRTIFGADVKLPNMLFGKVLRSSLPHARITWMDTSRAKALRGVKAVITAQDIPHVRYGFSLKDQIVFAREKVRYVGEPLAAVAAEDEDVAQEAVSLIRVDYEELAPVYDAEEAMGDGAPIIHEELLSYELAVPQWNVIRYGNVCTEVSICRGMVDRAFDQAHLVIEDTFTTQVVHQGYIEPHALVASVDLQGNIAIWTSAQSPFGLRATLSQLLRMPLTKIRIIGTRVGGGFGGKFDPVIEHIGAFLAKASSRPIKMVMDRKEEFEASLPRHSSKIWIRSGVDEDGFLMARQAKIILDSGAYADFGPMTVSTAAGLILGLYRIPDVKAQGYCVYTNKIPCGACRAPSAPQTMFALESHTDNLAHELRMDPMEFRLKNVLQKGDLNPIGQPLNPIALKDTIKKAADPSLWSRKRERGRGIGMGCAQWFTAEFGSSACLKINEDGTITALIGSTDIGTGSDTIIAQIIAEEMDVPMENIKLTTSDTDTTPYDMGSGGSRVTYNMGSAIKKACQDAKAQLLTIASNLLEVAPEDLEIKDGWVRVRGFHEKAVPLTQVIMAGYSMMSGPIIGKGSFIRFSPRPKGDPEASKGLVIAPGIDLTCATHVVEVEVDDETGAVRLLNCTMAQDVGKALNPMGMEGQMEGGFLQGMGFALTEGYHFSDGRVLNPNFMDYKLPTSLDFPKMKDIFVEDFPSDGPYGVKGGGELPAVPVAGALANAIYDAVKVRIKELPITPEKIFMALKEKKRG